MNPISPQKKTLRRIQDLIASKFFGLAGEAIERALVDDPKSKSLRLALLGLYVGASSYQEAIILLDELVKEDPENDQLFELYPRILSALGRDDDALERAFAYLKRKDDGDLGALVNLFRIYEATNQVEGMHDLLGRMKTKTPIEAVVKDGLQAKLYSREKRYEEAALLLDSACDALLDDKWGMSQSHIGDMVADLSFGAAKAYDRMGAYGKSWVAATRAHEANAFKAASFRIEDFEARMADTVKFFDGPTLRALARAKEPFEWQPLYIVGNPRSGTSLLEQILSMHPKVANGGEMAVTGAMQQSVGSVVDSYNEWPSSLLDMTVQDADALGRRYMKVLASFAGDATIVSNKALNLQDLVGFLSLVTPDSRAIMLYRHPLDNCVSCYTTNLLASGHVYCSNLDALARVWLARRRLQEHWLEHAAIPIMELQYESLVQNQEMETRRLIEFLGLEWTEECLQFYKSKFVARTISYDQVTRKMYTTSDGRWRNYEEHLGPLADRLSEYL